MNELPPRAYPETFMAWITHHLEPWSSQPWHEPYIISLKLFSAEKSEMKFKRATVTHKTYLNLQSKVNLCPVILIRQCETHGWRFRYCSKCSEEVRCMARYPLAHADIQHVKQEAQFTHQAELSLAQVGHHESSKRGNVVKHLQLQKAVLVLMVLDTSILHSVGSFLLLTM